MSSNTGFRRGPAQPPWPSFVDRMLAGAVPAALLALAVQGLFALLERRLVPSPLRAPTQRR